MTNQYQSPDVLKVGEAQDVILDQKGWGELDNLGLIFHCDAGTLGGFDE